MRPEVAFVGRSNVGKSSLLNALVGRRQIAKVSSTPGKTRLLNVFEMDERRYLVDLPGYGYAQVSKAERAAWLTMLYDYLETRRALHGVIWLLDIRHDPSRDDMTMWTHLGRTGRPVVAALTKSDKVKRSHRVNRVQALRTALGLSEDQVVVTSAKTREGIGDLREAVEQLG